MLPSGLKKKDTFDLTSASIFLEKPEYQKRVVELLKEFYPNRTVEGKNVKVCTFVFSIIRSVADRHRLWRKKTLLSDAEVACADQAAKQLGVLEPHEMEANFVAPLDGGARRMAS